jgi:DNA-directed RNA polymerases I, II, and III subunit RPABC2
MDEKYDEEDFDLEDEDEEEEDVAPTTVKKIKAVIRDKPTEAEDEDDDDIETEDEDDLEIDEDEDDDLEIEDADDVFDNTKPIRQNLPHFDELDDEDDDEEDDAIDENYLQKFDENLQKNIIADYHPELQSHNYNEIEIMSRVVRDEHGVIIDPLHKTLPFITRYEKARILGERAKQLNSGAQPFIELDANIIDGYLIATKEFEQKKIPFIIKRPLPNGGCEYWKFKDLEILM